MVDGWKPQSENRLHCVFEFLRNIDHLKKTLWQISRTFQDDRIPSVTCETERQFLDAKGWSWPTLAKPSLAKPSMAKPMWNRFAPTHLHLPPTCTKPRLVDKCQSQTCFCAVLFCVVLHCGCGCCYVVCWSRFSWVRPRFGWSPRPLPLSRTPLPRTPLQPDPPLQDRPKISLLGPLGFHTTARELQTCVSFWMRKAGISLVELL